MAVPAQEIPRYAASLADGRDVAIRNATARDLPGILDFFERLGPASRYSRFFSPQPRLRRAMIERVVAPGPDRVSLVAQPAAFAGTSRNVVAVGGWVYLPHDDRCEISIAVADDWQGVSLGTYVVLVLLRDAVARGYTRFAAEVLGSNVRMLGLLRDLGMPMRTSCEAGVMRLEFELPRGA
jgi:ribosomal protein S18 acetylase RimI-like enzyme